MIFLDVDGVLTDGGVVLGNNGMELKRFDVQDGMGVTLAQKAGIEVGIITGRISEAVRRRTDELDVKHVYQGHFWKLEALDTIRDELDVEDEQLGYVGDDVLDIPVMTEVGFSMAPQNARPEVKQIADWVAENRGGDGAIRELVDQILELRNQKEEIYKFYESSGSIEPSDR